MKNNKISYYQFLSSVFLSSLSFPLFVGSNPSVYLLVAAAGALLVNILVFSLYKGQCLKLVKSVVAVFLSIYCVVIISKFVDYMYNALSYGPLWLMLIILLAFSFFCTVKGVEALTRASIIISFFVVAGLVYMFVCTFSNINFNFTLEIPSNYLSVIILLIPSALYVLCFENIIPRKKYNALLYSVILFLTYVFFTLISSGIISPYPIQKLPTISEIGVFKGADCILLSILTISSLYSIAISTIGLFKSFKHRYITNAIYIGIIFILSLITVYYPILDFAQGVILPIATLAVTLLIIAVSLIRKRNMYKNS